MSNLSKVYPSGFSTIEPIGIFHLDWRTTFMSGSCMAVGLLCSGERRAAIYKRNRHPGDSVVQLIDMNGGIVSEGHSVQGLKDRAELYFEKGLLPPRTEDDDE